MNLPLEEKFLEGLWARGYFDLASDYLNQLKTSGKIDAATIPWLEARSTYEEAAGQLDLDRRRGLLDKASGQLNQFIAKAGETIEGIEARVLQVTLQVELAHLFWIESQDQPNQSQADALTKQARTRLADARKANMALIDLLTKREAAFKLPVLRDDPRRPEFEKTQLDRLNAKLQEALIEYEESQTYPEKSAQKTALLTKSASILQKLYETNRQQVAGQNARLWQAKCLQELGKLPEAAGIYGELTDQLDPALKDIRRRASYFRIQVYRDRGDFALAADEARRWIDAYADQLRTDDGLGVQLELAKNILLQLPKVAPNEKAAGERIARDRLGQVVRVYSRHQAEARKLLNQVRKSSGDTSPAAMDITTAMAAGQEALELKDWKRARACFEAAARKAQLARETTNYVKARYFESVAMFRMDEFYESYVLGEHLAKRYPAEPLAANAAEIALGSITYAYNALKTVDPSSDINRLKELGQYIVKTWPEAPQADVARITLAELARGQGRYDDAVKDLKAIRPSSDQFGEAQGKLGLTLWRKAQSIDQSTAKSEFEKYANEAIAAFQSSIKARQEKGVPAEDAKLIGTLVDLADVLIVSGKPQQSVPLLADAEKNSKEAPNELLSRIRRTKIRALMASDQLDQAVKDLEKAEKDGQATDELAALYFQLGQSLQEVMTEFKANRDGRLVRVRQTYQTFLKSLAASKAGQTWQALQWVAEAQLEDNQPGEALKTLQRIEKEFLSKQAGSVSEADDITRWNRSKLKLAEAARKAGQPVVASRALGEVSQKNPNLLPLLMERGRLLESQGKLNDALVHWRTLATRLGTMNPRPGEYYETWLELAHILEKQNKTALARQTLAGVIRLSGAKMPLDWKSRYEIEMKRMASSSVNTKSATGGRG